MDSNLESGEGKSANEGKNRDSEYGVSTDLATGGHGYAPANFRFGISNLPVFRVY